MFWVGRIGYYENRDTIDGKNNREDERKIRESKVNKVGVATGRVKATKVIVKPAEECEKGE